MLPEPEVPLKIEDFREYLMILARAKIPASGQPQLDASDIVQETLLEAHRKQDQFRGSEAVSMAAWLRQMLTCNLIDRRRSLGRRKRDTSREVRIDSASMDESSDRLMELVAAHQSSPSRQVVRIETMLQVAAALEGLPEAQRDALRMRYIEGLMVADISLRMKRSVTAVAGLLKRGLEALRKTIDSQ